MRCRHSAKPARRSSIANATKAPASTFSRPRRFRSSGERPVTLRIFGCLPVTARGAARRQASEASKEETAGGVCAGGSVGLWGIKARFCADLAALGQRLTRVYSDRNERLETAASRGARLSGASASPTT
jgi:hypothetical protein